MTVERLQYMSLEFTWFIIGRVATWTDPVNGAAEKPLVEGETSFFLWTTTLTSWSSTRWVLSTLILVPRLLDLSAI